LDELEFLENESELTLTSGHCVVSTVQKTHEVSHLQREIPPPKQALILAAGLGSRQKENGTSKPLIPLLGLTLIERIILTAKKAGISDFLIVVGYNGDKIRKHLADGRKLGVKLDYVVNDEWKRGNSISVLKAREFFHESFILLMADHIFDHEILNKLLKATIQQDECILCVDGKMHKYLDLEDATKVVVTDGRIIDIGKELIHYNGIDTGIFLCTPAIFDALDESIANGNESLSGGINILANKEKMKALDVSDKYWIDVDNGKALKNAESLLIKQLAKLTDGPIAKMFNRPVSLRISAMLLKTSITPNQVTLLSFIMGFFASLCFYFGDYLYLIAGGILVQISSIVDGCDGEIARLKLRQTNYGGWFDAVLDRYADGLIVFGMIYGHWTLHSNILIWTVGFAALIGTFLNSYTSDKYDSIFRKKLVCQNEIRMGRDVRLFIIFIGALSNQVLLTLAILAVITNFESVRRLVVLRHECV
jgi:CDP-L-myo-inositol myo-inositolphosphotransferase